MLELSAAYAGGEPVRVRDIAATHGIPPRFLVQILLQLKGAGYVTSTRGAAGGYQLAVAPDDLSVADVMTVLDVPDSGVTSSSTADSPASRALIRAWNEVAAVERRMLEQLNFAELAARVRRQAENMYYI